MVDYDDIRAFSGGTPKFLTIPVMLATALISWMSLFKGLADMIGRARGISMIEVLTPVEIVAVLALVFIPAVLIARMRSVKRFEDVKADESKKEIAAMNAGTYDDYVLTKKDTKFSKYAKMGVFMSAIIAVVIMSVIYSVAFPAVGLSLDFAAYAAIGALGGIVFGLIADECLVNPWVHTQLKKAFTAGMEILIEQFREKLESAKSEENQKLVKSEILKGAKTLANALGISLGQYVGLMKATGQLKEFTDAELSELMATA